jgi:hypothetical protein
MSMKNSNDTIENRTRDLPACTAVPQPTAPVFRNICRGFNIFYTCILSGAFVRWY